MARAYKVLANDEFFGDLSDIDWDVIKLIDKINLKAFRNIGAKTPGALGCSERSKFTA